MARKQRHTPEQVISKLRKAEVKLAKGMAIAQVCKELAVTENTYYRWRREYGGMKLDQARRLKVDFPTDGGRPVKGLSGPFVLGRRLVSRRRMKPDPVVKHLHVLEQFGPRLRPCGEVQAENHLILGQEAVAGGSHEIARRPGPATSCNRAAGTRKTRRTDLPTILSSLFKSPAVGEDCGRAGASTPLTQRHRPNPTASRRG